MKAALLSVLMAATASVIACSSVDDNGRVNANVGDRTTFPEVSAALARRCGSLDCHGSLYRNFRIYGYGALRLPSGEPGNKPDTLQKAPDGNTLKTPTEAEANATYDALVSLEPELTRNVLLSHGAGLDNLTLVRKGRGDERHKGGTLILRGDNADKCLVGWLSGTPDSTACQAVLNEN